MNPVRQTQQVGDVQLEHIAAVKEGWGSILLFHGLNLRPERLRDFAEGFAAAGLDAYIVYLKGHADDGLINRVTADDWRRQAVAALSSIELQEARRGGKIAILGYSMGALLGLHAAKARGLEEAIRFGFLSPCFRTNTLSVPFRVLTRLRRLSTSGFDFAHYRANRTLTFRPYLAVMDLVRELARDQLILRRLKAFVAYDPKDEIVNARYLAMLEQEPRDGWEFMELSTRSGNCPIHHLTMDRRVLGEDTFALLLERLCRFFRS